MQIICILIIFVSDLVNTTRVTAREISVHEYEKEIIERKEMCEQKENESRVGQVKCESELKEINCSLNGIDRLLEKDHKELKRRIDHVNENIENIVKIEIARLNESIGKQREYLGRLQAGKISKKILQLYSFQIVQKQM